VPVAGLEPLASGWRDEGSTTLPLLPVATTDTRRERKKFKNIFSTVFLSPSDQTQTIGLGDVETNVLPLYHFYESSPLAPGERKRLKMFFSLFFSLLVPAARIKP
jgi:hypothetical protein